MSDFDKEAERERLREKYEEDTEDREQTQRMSELLLQGATMTNKHCDACGSPVFRHDGQEFCPECHDVGAEEMADAPAEGETETAGGSADTTVERGTAAAESAHDGPATARSRGPEDRQSETTTSPAVDHQRDDTRATADAAGVDADLGEARASLVRTLAAMARRAEATDDPRRAKELLGAAREAAEAVAALDR